jgi:hypothetical protein
MERMSERLVSEMEGNVGGMIRLSEEECRLKDVDMLRLERMVRKRVKKDVKWIVRRYSRVDVLNKNVEWYGLGVIISVGVLMPILMCKWCMDVYEYYISEDYDYIEYEISA